jgi:serine/threonine-protein kinase SRPK3
MCIFFNRHWVRCVTFYRLRPFQHCFPVIRNSAEQRYTMSTAPVAYVDHYGENIEPLWHYCPWGYHPINIGDHLQSRYRIVDKLGHRSYSTIWLARDEQLAKYVAIKVGVARSDHKEVDVLTQLTEYGRQNGHHAEAFILPVLDRFDINGPNGVHPCFVTVPTRCSLRDSLLARNGFLFQTKTARSLTAQLA